MEAQTDNWDIFFEFFSVKKHVLRQKTASFFMIYYDLFGFIVVYL